MRIRKLVVSEMALAWPHLCHEAIDSNGGQTVLCLSTSLGYTIVTDDECKILGSNMVPRMKRRWYPLTHCRSHAWFLSNASVRQFTFVELNANGYINDEADGDFTPCKEWLAVQLDLNSKWASAGWEITGLGSKSRCHPTLFSRVLSREC